MDSDASGHRVVVFWGASKVRVTCTKPLCTFDRAVDDAGRRSEDDTWDRVRRLIRAHRAQQIEASDEPTP